MAFKPSRWGACAKGDLPGSLCNELLTTARDRTLLDFPDPEMAATQFLSLVRGDLPLYSALGVRARFSPALRK